MLINLRITTICLIALALRTTWALIVPVEPVSDSYLYNIFAQNIASGKGYSFPDGALTVYWPVGTSAIYASLYFIFGTSYLPIVFFNILAGTSIVWLTYKIALRHIGQPTAALAALLVAFWPIMIQFTTILASELIFILFVLASIYVWGLKQFNPIIRSAICGALICGASYVRPTALPLILLLPVVERLSGTKTITCLTQFVTATFVAAILFAPWVYRNYNVFNQFVLVSANGGANLWMGNNPKSNGGYMDLTVTNINNEVKRDQYFKKEAVEYIVHNPLSYVNLMLKRAVITYKSETIGVVWNAWLGKKLSSNGILALKLLSTLFWWFVVIFSATGIVMLIKNKILIWHNILFCVTAFFFIFPLLTVGQDRYHLPINPFLAIFAGYAIHQRAKLNIIT